VGEFQAEEATLFKEKVARVAALVLLVTGAAVLISCRAEVTAPEPVGGTGKAQLDTPGINGYAHHGITFKELPFVDVEWECETCDEFIGEDATDAYGFYEIDYDGDWSNHDGHNLKGYASRTGYNTATNTVTNFQSANIPYGRDFYLYPE
jgi:hypothetical protein